MAAAVKRYFVCMLVLGSIVVVTAGTSLLQKGKQKQPSKTTPPSVPKKQPASPQKTAPQPSQTKEKPHLKKDPAPKISLSLNLLSDATIPEDRSLLIEATISAYRGREGFKEFKLEKPGGAWSELLSVDIRDSQGKAIPGLTFKPLIRSETSITLDRERMGRIAWEADLKNGTKLPVGSYTMRVVLDSKSAGLKDKVESPPSNLIIAPAGAAVSEVDARILVVSEVRIFAYQGKISEGLAACEAYLAKKPDDSLLLEEKGDLLMRSNKPAEALSAYSNALKHASPSPENAVPEPPFGLLSKQHLAEEASKKG